MKKLFKYFLIIMVFLLIIIFGINFYVIFSGNNKIIEKNNYDKIKSADAILILGAGVWGDKPSPMLEDRLLEGINLYKQGIAKKIIMSGDHRTDDYDEVNIMKKYAIEKGVPSEDIFMDHSGLTTYESMYRAKYIFNLKKVVVVTQKYHLYRAIYIGNTFGLEIYGVNSDPRSYSGQIFREIREILARDKDFVKCIFKPSSRVLGDTIEVSGNGDVTNNKK